jgi:hypothetical protein
MSQIEETKKDKEIISFSYNETIYQKIAHDTIKKMYLNQKKMSEHSKSLGDDAISIKYDLNKLSIYIIPKFRLKRIAYELYTCDKNIEEFIEFEEKFKYMSAIVAKEKEFITMQTIPHPYFEIERVNTPDFRLKVDKFVYEESILKNFVSNEEYLINIQKDINKRSENFFFGIYGLWDVIFEVEKGTGKLFANKYDYNSVIHLPANEYLRKYEGQTRIRELSRGYYEDIDGTGFLEQIPCGSIESSEKQVFLKVNYD